MNRARRWRHLLGLMLAFTFAVTGASAAQLVIHDGTRRTEIDTAALLARPDRAEVAIARDQAYGGATRYQAVPLAALLESFPTEDPGGTLEAAATDGFAAQIPLAVVRSAGPDAARGWLAIEAPGAAWPSLPGKPVSAGPFYIVWERPAASGVSPEFWAYQVAALRYVASPARRWPQMTVEAGLPADHPARVGQAAYTAICLSCHRINGAGSADMGPDLNQPMSPVEYFRIPALRRYIRDPSSVRSWPEQKMPGFSADQLSEVQLDGLIAYFEHMVAHRPAR